MCLMVGLAGKARTGKDTAAMYLYYKFGFEVYSFATPIKDALKAMFGLTNEQIEGPEKEQAILWLGKSPRELMQTLGTQWGRDQVRPDVWMLALDQQFAIQKNFHKRLQGEFLPVVKDVRFENEAQWVRDRGGLLIHLERSNAGNVRRHESELGLEVMPGDIVIKNNESITALQIQLNDVISDELARRGFYD